MGVWGAAGEVWVFADAHLPGVWCTVVVKEALLPIDVCYVMLAHTCFGLFGRRKLCTRTQRINQVWQEVNRWLTWDVDLSLYFQWMKQNLNSSRCPVAARSVWTHSCQTVVRAMNLLGDRKLREDLTEVSRTWGGRACGVGGAEAESAAWERTWAGPKWWQQKGREAGFKSVFSDTRHFNAGATGLKCNANRINL